MPRNSSGTYSLPSGNPVVSGTLIESTWANNTLSDLATAMTDSLSRSGEGGMTAPLRLADGSVSVPGMAFTNETSSGLYRAGSGDIRLSITGSEVVKFLASGASVTGTLSATGNFAINTNKFTVDSSNGNTAVAGTLGVTGVATLSANPVLSAGSANGVPYLNGSKVLVSGSGLVFDGTKLGIGNASPYSMLDVGQSGADAVTSLFTTGVDDLNFRAGFSNGIAGSTGSLQARVGLFYLGSGEVATIGMYRGATATDGSLALRTAGNDRLYVNSAGNVGIGTSSPNTALSIRRGASTDAYIDIAGNNNTLGSTSLTIGQAADDVAYIFQRKNAALVMATNNIERMRIDSSGNVGIGTSSPGAKLEVFGTNQKLRISDGTNSLDFGQWDGTTNRIESSGRPMQLIQYGASNPITFATNATERARIDSAGQFYTKDGAGNVRPDYGCRAWVTFDGGKAISASSGVSSITDNGSSYFSVNFSTAFADVNYAPVIGASKTYATTRFYVINEDYTRSKSTTSFPAQSMLSTNALGMAASAMAFFR